VRRDRGHPDSLTEDQRLGHKAVTGRCPELAAASEHVRTFATMLTELTGQNLPRWISDVRAADLPGVSATRPHWAPTQRSAGPTSS
jgi:hypothetical protein